MVFNTGAALLGSYWRSSRMRVKARTDIRSHRMCAVQSMYQSLRCIQC